MRHNLIRFILLLFLLLLPACNRGGEQQGAQPTSTAAVETSAQEAAPTEEATEPTAEPTATVPPATPTERPGPTETAAPEEGTFVNPVLDQDFPDPDVLKVGDTYYAYATNTGNTNIQAARSTDLVTWEHIGETLPSIPSWGVVQFGYLWAPEVTTSADGQTYLMYYTARFRTEEGDGHQCIGVATSDSPEGPFRSPAEEPFICNHDMGGSIDAASFVDEDGTRYVLWKNDGNCCGYPTWLWIQQVSDDGLTLIGEPTQLIKRDQPWEGNLIEAPTLWKDEGKYYLFYSANDYSSPNYAVGYAVADNVLGPYEKPLSQPFLKTSIPAGVIGPGGQDIVFDPDGDTWMLYHTWDPESFRHMRIDELTFEDGAPVLLGPEREPQPMPSTQ